MCFGLLEVVEGPDAPILQLIFEIARHERALELAAPHSLLCFGFKEAGQIRLSHAFGDLVLGPQVAGCVNGPPDAGQRVSIRRRHDLDADGESVKAQPRAAGHPKDQLQVTGLHVEAVRHVGIMPVD